MNAGAALTLANNNGDSLKLQSNGAFTFGSTIPWNGDYVVTVADQPIGETCSIANNAGATVSANISSVAVQCAAKTYPISGTISGLEPSKQVVLSNTNGDDLIVADNGTFSFKGQVPYMGSYFVEVKQQPLGQTCFVDHDNGSDVVASANTVNVLCTKAIHAYVTTQQNQILQFGIGARSQLVPLNPPAVASVTYPALIAIDSTRHRAFIVDVDGETVSGFSIGSDGTLTRLATSPAPTGLRPTSIAIDPMARFVYITNAGPNEPRSGPHTAKGTISQYSIESDGSLTTLSPASVDGGFSPYTVTIDPTGRFVYAVQASGAFHAMVDNVLQFSIGSDGLLTPLATPTISVLNPSPVVISPSGKYAYIATESTISQFVIGIDGSLTLLANTPSNGGFDLSLDAQGRHVYSVNASNLISQFDVDADGTPHPMASPSVSGGPANSDDNLIEVDITGHLAFVSNIGTGQIFQFRVGMDGALVPSTVSPISAPNSVSIVTAQ